MASEADRARSGRARARSAPLGVVAVRGPGGARSGLDVAAVRRLQTELARLGYFHHVVTGFVWTDHDGGGEAVSAGGGSAARRDLGAAQCGGARAASRLGAAADGSVAGRLNPTGNERLTATVGALLLVPIVVELATIVLGVHTLMSLHVFVGFVLIPAVLLKLASTGWRLRPVLHARAGVLPRARPPEAGACGCLRLCSSRQPLRSSGAASRWACCTGKRC